MSLTRHLLPLLLAGLVAALPARAQFGPIPTPTGTIVAGPTLVADVQTGEVLWQQNAGSAFYPASLVKLMTLHAVFEELKAGRLKLEDRVVFSAHAASMPQTKLGIAAGQSITVEQAIIGLVIRSANDAAAALGERISGSEAAFAQRLTATAQRIGMTASSFRNASGLPDPGQVSTARDMAVLSIALVRDFPQYYRWFGAEDMQLGRARFERTVKFLNMYPGADGLKTGFICSSGFNLVASAMRDGRRLVGVALGFRRADLRDEAMVRLFDEAYAKKSGGAGPRVWQVANGGGTAPVVFGNGECGVRYDYPGAAVWLGTFGSDPVARSQIGPANEKLVGLDQGAPGREWIIWLGRNQQGHPTRFATFLADIVPARAQKLCDLYRKSGRFCVVKQPQEIVSPYAEFVAQPATGR